MSKKTAIATNMLGKEVRMHESGGLHEDGHPAVRKDWSAVLAEVCNVYINPEGTPMYSLIHLSTGEVCEHYAHAFIVPRTSTEIEARIVAANTPAKLDAHWKATMRAEAKAEARTVLRAEFWEVIDDRLCDDDLDESMRETIRKYREIS